MAATHTSLQRLLSLDKSFDSLDDRIQEATRILRLDAVSSSPSSTARLDFVLRWLLEKLSSQLSARQSLSSWLLLRRILERMPSAALAKSLSAAHPLKTCSQALADIFPSLELPIPQQPSNDSTSSTKKRKRQSLVHDSPSDQPSLIFAEICASVNLLISRSTPPPSAPDTASENRVHALLRLQHSDLVRFVKHSFFALLRLPLSASLVASSLTLIQGLSALQPNVSADPLDVSFCTECLWPAALLLRSLHSTSYSDASSHQHTQQAVQLIDRFLATHLFVPARAAFYTTKDLAPKERLQSEVPGLAKRLVPLRDEITALCNADNKTPVEQQLSAAYASIPLLLDLAVRCSPTATPKQRITEGPWIHHLFTSLADTFTNPTDTSNSVVTNQTLSQMLDVLSSKKLTLDSDVLVNILDQQCRLPSLQSSGNIQQAPDFALIARILDMDSSIFTDVNGTPARALFEALTIYGRAKSSDSNTVSANVWADPRAICLKIAVPLMQAYARTRNLPAFLEQWFASLDSQSTQSAHEWLLWTDSSLEDSLRAVLETSLTPAQIGELLDSRRDNLVQSLSSESGAVSQAFANIVLLNAIVGAVRTDAAADFLIPHLEPLIFAIESAFSDFSNLGEMVTARLIGLCSRLYHLWYPIWCTKHESEEVQARNTIFLTGSVTQCALRKIQSGMKAGDDLSASTVDSAFVLIASICAMQRRLTGHETDYAHLFCQAALPSKGDSSCCYAAKRPSAFLTVLTGFPELLSCVPTNERVQLFSLTLDALSNETAQSSSILNEFLDALFATADFAIKDDLFAAICSGLEGSVSTGLWFTILLHWPVKSFSRQQREKALNVTVSLLAGKKIVNQDKKHALEFIVNLFEVPNATANISVAAATLWELAGLTLDQTELDTFEDICKRLLRHILDTKEQDRSKSYLTQLSSLISVFIGKQKDLSLPSAPGKLRLFSVLLEATEARLEEADLSGFSHRQSSTIDSFVKRLWECLSSTSEGNLEKHDEDLIKVQCAVEAFSRIPASTLRSGGSSTEKYAKRFFKKLHNLLEETGSVPLPILVECFEKFSLTALKQEPFSMCMSAERLLGRDMDAKQYWVVTDSFTRSIRTISEDEKFSLIDRFIPAAGRSCTAERAVLVRCIISAIQDSHKNTRKEGLMTGVDNVPILVRLLELLNNCSEYKVHQQLIACVVTLLRDQPSLVTQYSAEMTIATVTTLASPASPVQSVNQASLMFEGLCEVTKNLLQFHRSSLGGRFHLLIPLMQRLLACLFIPASRDAGTANRFKHPAWLDLTAPSLTIKHASRYSRLLENLCNPPQSNVTGNRGKTSKSTPELVDETRKARMHVAQHAPHILHYFCTLILHGRLGEGMRDALTPGMWAVIDVAELGADDSRGIKALSASMGNADRAILRGIWEDWRRFGGAWKG